MISESNSQKVLQIKVKKVIKKSQKRKGFPPKVIEHDKLREAKIMILHTPPKIIAFNFSYKIPGDIYVDDHEPPKDLFVCLLCKLKRFKKISCVFHDRERKIIGCDLSDICKNEPPIELLISRLRTIGNIDAYHLSITIEKVLNFMKQFEKTQFTKNNQRIFEMESYNCFLQETTNLIKKLDSEGPIVIGRGSNLDDSIIHSLIQVAFNYNFIRLIGEDIESFPLQLLKKGIPDCIWIDQNYFQTLNKLINQAFFSHQLDEKIERTIKTKYINIRANSTSYIRKFKEANYSEIFVIQVFKIKKNDMELLKLKSSENMKKEKSKNIQDGQNITKMNHFNLILENNCYNSEESSMIKKYYPNVNVNYTGYEMNEKFRCGMKMIYEEF